MHKLAMVISASRTNSLVIEEQDLIRANDELLKIEKDMPKIYRNAGREKESSITDDIARHLKAGGRMTKASLYRAFMHKINYETFEKCMNSLSGSGLLEYEQENATTYVSIKEDETNVIYRY